MPIARSIPSSRVRSWIESASVLAIPNSEISDRQAEQGVDEADELIDLFFPAFLQFLLVQHFGDREGAFDAFGQDRLDLAGVGAGGGLDEVDRVLGLAEFGGQGALGDQDAAEDAELGGELADDFEARAFPGLGQQAEAVADFETVVGGEAVGEDRLVVAEGCGAPPGRPSSIRSRPLLRCPGSAPRRFAPAAASTSFAWAPRIVATVSTPGTLRAARRGPVGDRREAVAVLDHQAAGEVFVDHLGDRALQPGGEDGDEGDQREPDHQRRRGDRGAARVALRVLPGEAADQAAQAAPVASRRRRRAAAPGAG